jgi:hypothetical protein
MFGGNKKSHKHPNPGLSKMVQNDPIAANYKWVKFLLAMNT